MMEDYLLGFDPPEESDEYDIDWDSYDLIRGRFSTITINGPQIRLCPVCGGYHYIPYTFASGTTMSNEEAMRQICEMNRHTVNVGSVRVSS